MPRVMPKRSSPSLDMTPMVDLAFLLVTFFMLTTQFRPEELVEIRTPSSTATKTLADKGVITITVAPDGRAFFDMDNKHRRMALINALNNDKELGLTDEMKNTFAVLQGFGVPLERMNAFLGAKPHDRKLMQTGIPYDSANNQLVTWVRYARSQNPDFFIAIKGDAGADYENVKAVMDVMKKTNVHTFSLITSAEGAPTITDEL